MKTIAFTLVAAAIALGAGCAKPDYEGTVRGDSFSFRPMGLY